jgi:hypothetical protein
MSPRPQEIRVDNYLSGTRSDTGVKTLLNGGLGQFHMCVANNLKIRHLLDHPGDPGEELVRIIPGTAVIDQEEGLSGLHIDKVECPEA